MQHEWMPQKYCSQAIHGKLIWLWITELLIIRYSIVLKLYIYKSDARVVYILYYTSLCRKLRENNFSIKHASKWNYIRVHTNASISHSLSVGGVCHGVHQGSVLSLFLFSVYILSLWQIIRAYGLGYHFYADDAQISC